MKKVLLLTAALALLALALAACERRTTTTTTTPTEAPPQATVEPAPTEQPGPADAAKDVGDAAKDAGDALGNAVDDAVDLHEITCTSCLPESAPAALSSVNVPRHASLLRLAWTNSS